jgi:polar amino acid transport system permease protein
METLLFFQQEVIPAFLKGLRVSILLILPSGVIGLGIGVVTGALRAYGNRRVRLVADTYATLFRGVPLVVQLFMWYFGLPYFNVYLSPFAASVIGFSLCSGAYHSEYVRGAFLSIKRGQLSAALALGFTRLQMVTTILLPQGFRRALPGCGNEFIYLVKYSSLAYMITCIELTGEAKILASMTFRYTEIFFAVGLVYLVLVTFASWLLQFVEVRFTVPGFEHHKL